MSEPTKAGYLDLPITPDPYRYDHRGANPSTDPQSYRALRDEYAKPLAFNHVTPTQPQQDMTNAEYERALLGHLAKYTERFARTDIASTPLEMVGKFKDQIVSEALQGPTRRGELASYTYSDRSGRDITEFAGPKSSWMGMFTAPTYASGVTFQGKHYDTVSAIPLSSPPQW